MEGLTNWHPFMRCPYSFRLVVSPPDSKRRIAMLSTYLAYGLQERRRETWLPSNTSTCCPRKRCSGRSCSGLEALVGKVFWAPEALQRRPDRLPHLPSLLSQRGRRKRGREERGGEERKNRGGKEEHKDGPRTKRSFRAPSRVGIPHRRPFLDAAVT